MTRCPSLRSLVVAASLGAATVLAPAPLAAAQSGACPDNNTTVQDACYLGPGGPALGVITAPGELRCYRFEALDFGTTLKLDLWDAAVPLRMTVYDWTGGRELAVQPGQGATTSLENIRLGPPGSYYVCVDSQTGATAPTTPFKIQRHLDYPGRKIPSILFSDDFPPSNGEDYQDRDDAEVAIQDGKFYELMAYSGSSDEPAEAPLILKESLVTVTDFTMSLDTRIESGSKAGYEVYFRYKDEDNHYVLAVDPIHAEAKMYRMWQGHLTDLTDWVDLPLTFKQGVMNHTVVKATGPNISVNINGYPVPELSVKDGMMARGMVGFGGITWGDRSLLAFDNLLVTTPTEG